MLKATMEPISGLTQSERAEMFLLMDAFYENITEETFLGDLREKDHCILLKMETGEICGFSTLKFLELEVLGKTVHGVFSGDTIIHKDHWGSTQLFRVFLQEILPIAEKREYFFWFLISKGYKTYQMLPLFFKEFYPGILREVPPFEQAVMDGYATLLYGSAYNPKSGLVEYPTQKDFLRSGVAEVDGKATNKHTAYFLERNPTHTMGTDLVCLAGFNKANLGPAALRMMRG